MDIDNPYMNVMTALTVPDIDDVTVVDYDALEERIYWADVKTQTIKRAFINGTQLETIISAGRYQQNRPQKKTVFENPIARLCARQDVARPRRRPDLVWP